MKIGVRAHDYGRFTVAKLAALLKREGYDAAQLVLPKAFTGVDSYAAIDGWLIESVRREFDRQKIEIAVFGQSRSGNPAPGGGDVLHLSEVGQRIRRQGDRHGNGLCSVKRR